MMLANDELTIEEKLRLQIDQLESIINDLDDITNTSSYRLGSSISGATRYLIEARRHLTLICEDSDGVSAEKGVTARD
jgi:hypothetical protein